MLFSFLFSIPVGWFILHGLLKRSTVIPTHVRYALTESWLRVWSFVCWFQVHLHLADTVSDRSANTILFVFVRFVLKGADRLTV